MMDLNFEGFTQSDFDVFQFAGLDERMHAIQVRIQPKFRVLGNALTQHLTNVLGTDMYLHIARHARRTVNPPNDTWLAIANNKRGYKKHPHFQVGLFDDRLFIWLAFIYELPNKSEMATTFLNHREELKSLLPNDFVISTDHLVKEATKIDEVNLAQTLERFRDVKRAEWLIGRQILSSDPLVQRGSALYERIVQTFDALIPLYFLAYNGTMRRREYELSR